MDQQPNGLASQESRTVSNNSGLVSGTIMATQNALAELNRKLFNEGLIPQWKIENLGRYTYGSLKIAGGYIARDIPMFSAMFSTTSTNPVQTLKRLLAIQALQWFEEMPIPHFLGAREEQVFVKSCAAMFRNLQNADPEKAAYMKHRIRLELSTDGGMTLGPLPSELFQIQQDDSKMEDFALRTAQALEPERYGKVSDNFTVDPNEFQDVIPNYMETAKSNSGGASTAQYRAGPLPTSIDHFENSMLEWAKSATPLGDPNKGERISEESDQFSKPAEFSAEIWNAVDVAKKQYLWMKSGSPANDTSTPTSATTNSIGTPAKVTKNNKKTTSKITQNSPGTSDSSTVPKGLKWKKPLTLMDSPKKRRRLSEEVEDGK